MLGKKAPPTLLCCLQTSPRPTALICLKALTAVRTRTLTCTYYDILVEEVFTWTPAGEVIHFHSCTVAVKIPRLLSSSFFFSFSLPRPSHLNWVGDKNAAGYTWLTLKLISELLQKQLENRSGLTWISLRWGTPIWQQEGNVLMKTLKGVGGGCWLLMISGIKKTKNWD